MKGLTLRQRQVLEAIQGFMARNRGVPPAIRELGEALGIRSTNGVNDHLKALEKKGYIDRGGWRGKSRILALAQPDPGLGSVLAFIDWLEREGLYKRDRAEVLRMIASKWATDFQPASLGTRKLGPGVEELALTPSPAGGSPRAGGAGALLSGVAP